MKDIIKGIIIGVGKIIPGVSGSVLALSMGVYERAIRSLNCCFRDVKSMFFLFKLFLGILISVIFGSKIILHFLNNYYSITIMVFIGLILGSSVEIRKNIQIKYWYLTIIFFLIIFFLGFLDVNVDANSNIFGYFISGIIESLSSIIPGVSGTILLMLIGYYDKVMSLFSNMFNFNFIINNISFLLFFSLGILFGLYFSIKLINHLFNKYFHQTYNMIYGLLIGSVSIMLKNIISVISVKSLFFFLISFIVIKKINHFF